MSNGTNFKALREGFQEFLMNEELVSAGARLKSLTFEREPGNPNGAIFVHLVVTVPCKMQVVYTNAPQNAMGFAVYEQLKDVSNIVGVDTHVRTLAADQLEIHYTFDSGGKVPNHPEFIAHFESLKNVAE